MQVIRCLPTIAGDVLDKLVAIQLIEDDDVSWIEEVAVTLCCRKRDARITNATRLENLQQLGTDGVDKNPEFNFRAIKRRGANRHVCNEKDELMSMYA